MSHALIPLPGLKLLIFLKNVQTGSKLFTQLFTTDRQYPVLTAGHGNAVELLLRRSGMSAGSAASRVPLENTYWKLTRLGDAPFNVASQRKEPYLIFNSASRRVSGSGGCNQLAGSYERSGSHLNFGQMAGTMMEGPQGWRQRRHAAGAGTREQVEDRGRAVGVV